MMEILYFLLPTLVIMILGYLLFKGIEKLFEEKTSKVFKVLYLTWLLSSPYIVTCQVFLRTPDWIRATFILKLFYILFGIVNGIAALFLFHLAINTSIEMKKEMMKDVPWWITAILGIAIISFPVFVIWIGVRR